MQRLCTSTLPTPRGHYLPPIYLAAAWGCIIGAIALLGFAYHSIAAATPSTQWPNTGAISWVSIASCNESLAQYGHPQQTLDGTNYFTLHMFFMVLAFGFFGPVASVTYYVLEDGLKLPHVVAKSVHAALQSAALLTSVLGFIQIYYSAGGYCSFADHFLSLHSFVGITVLAVYWLQGPLAFLVFSNGVLLPPGGAPRRAFLRVHKAMGTGLTLAGLGTIILGILAFEVKRTQWEVSPGPGLMYIWYDWSRTGMVAAGLLLLVAFIHCYKPSDNDGGAGGIQEIEKGTDQLLELAVPSSTETVAVQDHTVASTGP